MVALNWQQMDAANMLNCAMFENNTRDKGWVLKPESHRGSLTGGTKRQRLSLNIRIFAAQGLDMESRSPPNAFVKCELHAEGNVLKKGQTLKEGKNEGAEWKQRTPARHSHDPDFAGENIRFEDIEDVIPESSFIR